jgi:tRNA modification GTPase
VFSTDDTIVAIATPPGRGGIGVVRLSGRDAQRIASALIERTGLLEPRRATLTCIRSADGTAVDQVVVTYFPAPASYSGDDVVEISGHGSPVILKGIVQLAIDAGARLAEPGEFTLRAFLNGRMDLMQAEAVGDLIDAVTPLQARTAFDQLQGTLTRVIGEIDRTLFDLVARLEASVDFPDEGYHFLEPGSLAQEIDGIIARTQAMLTSAKQGRLVREGLSIAIVGRPNVGKSSLFNALSGAARAIVNEQPGTTRDLVTETVDLDGLRVTLVDTAGLRETIDPVESEGVRRSEQALKVADLVLLVLDGSRPLDEADAEVASQHVDNKTLIVTTKQDLGEAWSRDDAISVSSVTGFGLPALRQQVFAALDFNGVEHQERPEITNVRHAALVEQAQHALLRARAAVVAPGGPLPEEFVLADLQEARAALEEITGKRVAEDVLAHIFERFCVGK